MRSASFALFTLLATPLLPAHNATQAPPDGLAILQAMSSHYAAAKSWYIDATEERTTWNEYSRTWTKTVMIGAVSGNRYHFEGHSQTGSALHISDGTTAWDVHPEEHAYMKEAAPANGFQPPQRTFMSEAVAGRAVYLLKGFSEMASHDSAATRLPDENLTLNGKTIPCYVVRVTSEQRKGPHTADYTSDETLWIEQQTWAVRKTVKHEHSFLIVAGTVRVPLRGRTVTTDTTVILNGHVPDSLFRFDPPRDLQLVAKFSDSLFGADLAGKQAADVQLVGADGKLVPLSSYRDKPVLLYFWATWCAPCIEGMPKLAALEQEARPKGLVLLSVDEDEDVKKGNDYLAQHHYSWPNTQDDGKIGNAFSRSGIPLYVLVDGTGKIAFYRAGSGKTQEAALRKAIAGLGPQYAALAEEQKPQPCEPLAH